MKTIFNFILSCLLAFAIAAPINGAVAAKKSCVCKHTSVKKQKNKLHRHCYSHRHHQYRTYYSPGYCEEYGSACGSDVVCYPGHYYKCWTDYYYHSGRNTARVEICE